MVTLEDDDAIIIVGDSTSLVIEYQEDTSSCCDDLSTPHTNTGTRCVPNTQFPTAYPTAFPTLHPTLAAPSAEAAVEHTSSCESQITILGLTVDDFASSFDSVEASCKKAAAAEYSVHESQVEVTVADTGRRLAPASGVTLDIRISGDQAQILLVEARMTQVAAEPALQASFGGLINTYLSQAGATQTITVASSSSPVVVTAAPTTYPTAFPTASPTTSPTPACAHGRYVVVGGLYNDDSGCTDCAAGTFSNTLNAATCDNCTAGHYQDATKATECIECSVGTYSLAESRETACDDCVTGQYQTAKGKSKCIHCEMGTYGEDTLSGTDPSHCVHCPPGEHQNNTGSVVCEQCLSGTFSNSTKRGGACDACVTGQYQPMKGGTSCFHCAVGRFGQAGQTGADAIGHCTGCSGGTYQPDTASTSCINCASGKFSTSLLRDNECDNCPSGQYQTTVGKISCDNCTHGKFGDVGDGASTPGHCVSCVAGTFNEDEAQTSCVSCSQGRYSDGVGRHTDCDHCPSGKYQALAGFTNCTACVAGKHGDDTTDRAYAESHCSHCPAGQFQIASGSTSCSECASGSYTPVHSTRNDSKLNSECIACSLENLDAVRTWWTANLAGASECTKKPVACTRGAVVGTVTGCTKSCRTKHYYENDATAAHWEATEAWGSQHQFQVPTYDHWTDEQGAQVGHWGDAATCASLDEVSEAAGRNTTVWESAGHKWRITNECNMDECPTDCVVSEWGAFAACTQSCTVAGSSSGTMTRLRNVTVQAHEGGKPCPTLTNSDACNPHPCPIDCVVTPWAKYAACTKTCNGGTRQRSRTITTAVEHGGKICPALQQSLECGAQKCGTDCKVERKSDTPAFAAVYTTPTWVTVNNGWKGAAIEPANYCNQCQCLDGEYTCTQRHCGPQFAHTCKSMTCAYAKSADGAETLQVNHHHKDTTTHHKCGYNLATSTCVCRCD
jgi:hypothetical protein